MTLIDKAEALAPCPFCGGKPYLANVAMVGCAYVVCTDCRMQSDDGSQELVVAAWNRRALPAVVPGVKPLVWEAGERDQRRADSILGELCVTFFGGHWFYQGEPRKGMLDAQAAAQQDYESRILSALAPSPARDVREAARLLHDMLHMKNGAHEGITKEDAQTMWDAASGREGYAAVEGFLRALIGEPRT